MKILVVRFSSIGDIVLTTPVVRCLKEQTGAEVHYLTKARYLPLLAANPFISKVYSIQKDIPEILPQLKNEAYDFIVDLHHNLRTFRLKKGLSVPYGNFPKLNLEKWLFTTFKINKLPDLHIIDRYFEAVKTLKINNDGSGLDYFIPPTEEIDPGAIHPEAIPGHYFAFAIGGKFQTKQLPVDMITELCKKINKPVILLGGKEDILQGKSIASKAGDHIKNACGKLTINGSASIIAQSQKVITHDTGMMHIAAAFKKPIISIWGNTVPAFGMTPYYGKEKSQNISCQVNGLSCRPCSKLGYSKCPKSHFKCMRDIDLDKILEML